MKKKLSSKKCIALVLAVIMIITSIPFMMVGAVVTGSYDPAPYWGDPDDEYGAINTNFVATLNTDGSVDISFPNAKAQKTYNYLVKKVVFNISVLPIVKLISALFVHLFFVCFIMLLYCLYGYLPDWYYLQIFYYPITHRNRISLS